MAATIPQTMLAAAFPSRRFGAALAINPRTADAEASILDWTGGRGVDRVLEATGRESAVNLALRIVRRGGRIAVYGVFGHPIQMDVDRLMYQEGEMVGTVGSRDCWPTAVKLLGERKVDLKSIVSRTMPVSALREAFDLIEKRQGVIKIVLVPDD